ncbi:MAG: hypothetical protein QOD32_3278, partial [Pyrinomonadaceae bacterium]|nr:hypothetical protein [Pyrinomonadaceae bacterium]
MPAAVCDAVVPARGAARLLIACAASSLLCALFFFAPLATVF